MSAYQNQYIAHRDGRGRFLLQGTETGIVHGLAFPGFPGESAHAFSRDYGSVSYPEEIQNLRDLPELSEMPFFTMEGMGDLSPYFNDPHCQEIWPMLGTLARQNGFYYSSPTTASATAQDVTQNRALSRLLADTLLWSYQIVNPKGSWNLPIVASAVNAQGIWLGVWDGQLFVVDHQGDEIQRYALPKPSHALTIVGEEPWVSCDDGNLYDLTAKLPESIYTVRPEGDLHYHYIIWAIESCADGVVIADAYGHLWRLLPDLSLGWHYHSPQCWQGCWVGVDATQVYWGYYHGVIAFDLQTGKEVWRVALPAPVLCGAVLDHEVIVGCSDRSLYRLAKTPDLQDPDLQTQEPAVRKVYTSAGLPYTIAVTPDQSSLFVGDFTGQIEQLAINPDQDPSAYDCVGRLALNGGAVTRLQIWNDRLYAGTNLGRLFALSRHWRGV
jgi:outer membrane protein assembly factor BamB